MTFRKRLENSKLLERGLSWLLAGYLRFCLATTRWQSEGLDELRAALGQGPIILVLWHSRLLFGPVHWPRETAALSTLRDPSPAGRLSAATQTRFGMDPFEMHDQKSNRAASRAILRRFGQGISLGLTADGPLGPARQMKSAPVEWARATGHPVFFYAFSVARHRRLSTWDAMMIPLPFTKGAFVYRRWNGAVERRADSAQIAQSQLELERALDAVQGDADAMVGLQPGT
jgi:lysophospholipid acyltransferase (LPLAT)-like uncharacterized protein